MGDWTFFSNHGHVLVCLARDCNARLRDVAVQVGITERAVQKIVRDLQDEGFLEVSKHGRRNRYRINNRKSLRHPLQSGVTVGQLLNLLSGQEAPKAKRTPAEAPTAAPRTSTPPKPDRVPEKRPEPAGAQDNDEPRQPSDLEQGRLF